MSKGRKAFLQTLRNDDVKTTNEVPRGASSSQSRAQMRFKSGREIFVDPRAEDLHKFKTQRGSNFNRVQSSMPSVRDPMDRQMSTLGTRKRPLEYRLMNGREERTARKQRVAQERDTAKNQQASQNDSTLPGQRSVGRRRFFSENAMGGPLPRYGTGSSRIIHRQLERGNQLTGTSAPLIPGAGSFRGVSLGPGRASTNFDPTSLVPSRYQGAYRTKFPNTTRYENWMTNSQITAFYAYKTKGNLTDDRNSIGQYEVLVMLNAPIQNVDFPIADFSQGVMTVSFMNLFLYEHPAVFSDVTRILKYGTINGVMRNFENFPGNTQFSPVQFNVAHWGQEQVYDVWSPYLDKEFMLILENYHLWFVLAQKRYKPGFEQEGKQSYWRYEPAVTTSRRPPDHKLWRGPGGSWMGHYVHVGSAIHRSDAGQLAHSYKKRVEDALYPTVKTIGTHRRHYVEPLPKLTIFVDVQ